VFFFESTGTHFGREVTGLLDGTQKDFRVLAQVTIERSRAGLGRADDEKIRVSRRFSYSGPPGLRGAFQYSADGST
jgi:hypothetical protein